MKTILLVTTFTALMATAQRAGADRCTFQASGPATAADNVADEVKKALDAATSARADATKWDKTAADTTKPADERRKAGTEADAARRRAGVLQADAARMLLSDGAQAPGAVDVDTGARVTIGLTNPPPTRLRISFDELGGKHAEVEWDPAVASELNRTVSLDGGHWLIGASAEPSTYNQQTGTVSIQVRFDGLVTPQATAATIEGTYVAAAISTSKDSAVPVQTVLGAWPRPRVSLQCQAGLPAIEALPFASIDASRAAGDGLRGFGVAPSFVTDTLAILAEIAVDRARAGALKVLKDRLVDPFCKNTGSRVTLKKLHLGGTDDIALPRTCELLDTLRLDDILSSGRPLLVALRDDLRLTIAPAAVMTLSHGRAPVESGLRAVVSILNAAIDHGGLDGIEGQVIIELLGQMDQLTSGATADLRAKIVAKLTASPSLPLADIAAALMLPCATKATCTLNDIKDGVETLLRRPVGQWKALAASKADALAAALVPSVRVALDEALADATDHDLAAAAKLVRDGVRYACQARLVVAVVKDCSRGTCSAADILARLDTPQSFYAVDRALPQALCWKDDAYIPLPADAAAARRFVIDGLRLLAPVIDGAGRDRAKAAVQLVVQLMQRLHPAADGAPDPLLEMFGEMAIAVIDQDYGTAFGRFVRLASEVAARQATPSKLPPEVRRLAQLVGAVASYAAVYRSTKDEDPAVAREARKRALSSIIDTYTDRSDRAGDYIVSIGSNVGMSFDGLADDSYAPALRVPLQVSFEWLPGERRAFGKHLGYRVAAQAADLGQFVRTGDDDQLDDVRWADFVSPGVEAGLLIGDLSSAVNLSVHVSYAPSIEEKPGGTDGVWRYGIAASYYVPFLDLN